MRKLIITAIAGLALAAAAATGSTASSGASTLKVVMRDPGCHWFYDHGKDVKSVTRHGSVTLANYDEAALKIKGPNGTKKARVGAKLTLAAKGVYRITMVGQAPDDNTLKLTIK